MKRPVALALAAGAAALALAAGALVRLPGRRAHTYRLLDSLAAVPLGMTLDSLRRAFPWLYCREMKGHPADHTPVCAADADGRDVRLEVPAHRVALIAVMVFGRDMRDLVAWAQARLGVPRHCSLEGIRVAWWSMKGTTVTLTEPPPGGRARELVIRVGGGAPPGCA
jgi:hypothetical protein